VITHPKWIAGSLLETWQLIRFWYELLNA